MDIQHLALLRELADRKSITAVAEATGKTPSAVSQQLRALQRDAGLQLIERVGRGVRLTDAGVELAEQAVAIGTAIARAEARWDAYRAKPSGTVRAAFLPSAAELLVPGLITALDAYPEIRLEIIDSDVSQDDFAAVTIDADIVVAHRSDDSLPAPHHGLDVIPLLREPLDVALPLGHRWATHTSVTPQQVISDTWISVPDGYPLDRVLHALAVQSGQPAQVSYRSIHLPLIEKMVQAGHGIALLPRFTSREHAAGRFALVPLEGFRAGRQLEALLRPDRAQRRAVRIVAQLLLGQARLIH